MKKYLWISDLTRLFFPCNCPACGKALIDQENVMCLACAIRLPVTHFHLHDGNPVERIFWGRVPMEAATSFLFFNKGGAVQRLIHALKYRGKRQVGIYLGELFGTTLKASERFRQTDLVIPVPLHPLKEAKRGYNQSEMIGWGISRAMDIPMIADNLARVVNTATQTRKSRYSRWENVKDVFTVRRPQELEGKTILLVDDVLTTGATLEACAGKMLETARLRLSMATLAYAQG